MEIQMQPCQVEARNVDVCPRKKENIVENAELGLNLKMENLAD